jgi:hypothetical protein
MRAGAYRTGEQQANHRSIQAFNEQVLIRFMRFVREALPANTPASRVEFGTQLLLTVLESVGRSVARRNLPRHAVDKWARVCADTVTDSLGLD